MVAVNLTPEEFAKKSLAIKAEHGINIVGNAGTISQSGCTISYSYDGKTLTLDVIHKPMIVTKAYVEKLMTDWLVAGD